MMPHIIVDTDIGIDDALALIQMFKDHKAGKTKIVLMLSSGGNLPLHETTRNLYSIRNHYGLEEIPIIEGFEIPDPVVIDVHGTHGLPTNKINQDVIIPLSDSISSKRKVIANVFLQESHSGEPLYYFMLGRATNLDIISNYDNRLKLDVVSMGGTGGNKGNMGSDKEFNVMSDPISYQNVVKNHLVSQVSLKTTEFLSNTFSRDEIDELPDSIVKDLFLSYGDLSDFTPCHDLITYLWWRDHRDMCENKFINITDDGDTHYSDKYRDKSDVLIRLAGNDISLKYNLKELLYV